MCCAHLSLWSPPPPPPPPTHTHPRKARCRHLTMWISLRERLVWTLPSICPWGKRWSGHFPLWSPPWTGWSGHFPTWMLPPSPPPPRKLVWTFPTMITLVWTLPIANVSKPRLKIVVQARSTVAYQRQHVYTQASSQNQTAKTEGMRVQLVTGACYYWLWEQGLVQFRWQKQQQGGQQWLLGEVNYLHATCTVQYLTNHSTTYTLPVQCNIWPITLKSSTSPPPSPPSTPSPSQPLTISPNCWLKHEHVDSLLIIQIWLSLSHAIHTQACKQFTTQICTTLFCWDVNKMPPVHRHNIYTEMQHAHAWAHTYIHTHTHLHTHTHKRSSLFNSRFSDQMENIQMLIRYDVQQLCSVKRIKYLVFHIVHRRHTRWQIPD